MKKLLISGLIITIGAIIFFIAKGAKTDKPLMAVSQKSAASGFVVMELFTSQGCSSCPPADDLLGKYAAQNNTGIIPLAFHVDYWNRLGWKDSFSTSGFSQRQEKYAQLLSKGSVYTPQVIINGETEMVGSDEDKIAAAVKQRFVQKPLAVITLSSQAVSEGKLSIQYAVTGNIANSNLLVMLIQNKAITKIKAGENNGATLTSYNVVRNMVEIPAQASGTCSVQIPGNTSLKELSIVAFTQNTSSLKITGAVKKDLF